MLFEYLKNKNLPEKEKLANLNLHLQQFSLNPIFKISINKSFGDWMSYKKNQKQTKIDKLKKWGVHKVKTLHWINVRPADTIPRPKCLLPPSLARKRKGLEIFYKWVEIAVKLKTHPQYLFFHLSCDNIFFYFYLSFSLSIFWIPRNPNSLLQLFLFSFSVSVLLPRF